MSGSNPGLKRKRIQLFSTASATPLATNNRPLVKGQEPGLHDPWKARDSWQAGDIIVDDLSATLEAHRARNRAAVIRKITLPDGDVHTYFKRPLFQYAGAKNGEPINGAGRERSAASGPKLNERITRLSKDTVAEEQDDLDEPKISKSSVTSKKMTSNSIWPADSVQAKLKNSGMKHKSFTRSVDPLEYFGITMFPNRSWTCNRKTPEEFSKPWLPYMDGPSEDHLERLSSEIRAFEAFMTLSPSEESAAQLVMAECRSIVKNIAPTNPLTLLGSRSSGLASPTSDFDFSMSVPSTGLRSAEMITSLTSRELIKASLRVLRKIEKGLCKHSRRMIDVEMVAARVPLVNCKHQATGLRIQLQTMSQFQAAQQYTAAYLAELPSLRPLYVLIRHFLEMRNLTTVFEGGLGSYTILMMIVTALKHASGKFAPQDLGAQLLHILDFYGNADLYTQGFSASPPSVFGKSKYKRWPLDERLARSNNPQLRGIDEIVQKSETRKPYLLCLQDPANYFNDLGRNAYAIKHIQATFRHARSGILKSFENRDSNRLVGEWSALNTMLRANYKSFELERSRTERYVEAQATFLDPVDSTDDGVKLLLEKRLQTYKEIQEAGKGMDHFESGHTPKSLKVKEVIVSDQRIRLHANT